MQVLARIPEDVGMQIIFDPRTNPFLVEENLDCEICSAKASMVIKGLSYGVGFEPMVMCRDCIRKIATINDDPFDLRGIMNKAPDPGHVFVVDEVTCDDWGMEFIETFASYREAVGFYMKCSCSAINLGGLFPGAGVLHIPIQEAIDDHGVVLPE